MFLVKGVLKICSKFTREHPYQRGISAMNRNLPLIKHESSAFTYLSIMHSKYNYTIHIFVKSVKTLVKVTKNMKEILSKIQTSILPKTQRKS